MLCCACSAVLHCAVLFCKHCVVLLDAVQCSVVLCCVVFTSVLYATPYFINILRPRPPGQWCSAVLENDGAG